MGDGAKYWELRCALGKNKTAVQRHSTSHVVPTNVPFHLFL